MVILKIAFRNLFFHKVKTLVIGTIIIIGTVLAIVGNSFVSAIASGMQRSLTESVTGEIQIYSAEAKEKISIFGDMTGAMPDIGHLNDFGQMSRELKTLPNVESVVPMGTNFAMWNPGNMMDSKLEELRATYKAIQNDKKGTKENTLKQTQLKAHVRALTQMLKDQLAAQQMAVQEVIAIEKDDIFKKAPEKLAEALSPEFWATFDKNSEKRIEFLGNNIAPLIVDETMLFLSYMGTSPKLFKETFSQFEITQGTAIPDGKRGFLFSQYSYENMIKNRVARKLDQIKKRLDKNGAKLSENQQQKDAVIAVQAQAAEIYSQLAPADADVLLSKMQEMTGVKSKSIKEQVEAFLKLDDQNFLNRYSFFYKEIAPKIVLYKVKIGDVFPITAFSKSGYARSVNMKVYGVFRFKSFDSSPLSGSFNLMDMVSFRDLYGFMTAERMAETEALAKEMGVVDLDEAANSADRDALFGEMERDTQKTETVDRKEIKTSAAKVADSNGSLERLAKRRTTFDLVYTDSEINDGVFLNAAVKLKDPTQIKDTLDKIKELSQQKKLGIQAVSWRDAAGITGQLIVVVRAVLYLLVAITFGIATFIIMNSMLMATLERTKEIGTMRAIGAQRKFLLKLFFQETALLSLCFGSIGVTLGIFILKTVGAKGIPAMGDPAQGDVSTFFFSGDRLYLGVDWVDVGIVFICMTIVALISTQYPAWRAMKISPLEAMQSRD